MRLALAALAAEGAFSVETYKARAAALRGPVTTPEEREESRRFNRERKRKHKGFRCASRKHTGPAMFFPVKGAKCYWCRRADGELPAPAVDTKKPETVTTDNLRPVDPLRNALLR